MELQNITSLIGYVIYGRFLSDSDCEIEKATALFYAAARRGHGDAMFEFGKYWAAYEHDEKEAMQWFKRAALLGHEAAAERIK